MEAFTNDDTIDRASKRIKLDPGAVDNQNHDQTKASTDSNDTESLALKTDQLKREVEKGQELVRAALRDIPRDESWDQTKLDLDYISEQDADTQCKIVLLGPSGVGKSTLANSLLDQADLLPSSGTGDACTAVPIEIHLNNDPGYPDLKAQIQFIDKAEWCSIIEQAKREIGVEYDDEDTDRSQGALQRLKDVYPLLSENDFGVMSADEIIRSNESAQFLGKSHELDVSDRIKFIKDFKRYIGSLKRPEFQTWPMVDHARLCVHHPILENGLVLVDIPGMFETNRARVENAAAYLRKCSAVCILTRASRSGTDGQQESLFNRALNQIQFDQRLDSILLVCTMSEEVVLRETANELDVPEAQALQSQLDSARADQDKIENDIKAAEKEYQHQSDIAKYRAADAVRWIKAQTKAATDWDSFVAPRERLSGRKFAKAEPSGEIWTEEDVNDKISTLKEDKVAAVSRCKQLNDLLAKRTTQLAACKARVERLTLRTKQAVFEARNNLVKDQQAKRYLATVEKFNVQSSKAAERTLKLIENHVEQEEALSKIKAKVFCVSALAYSYLSKLKSHATNKVAATVDDISKYADIITRVQDTEIPALADRLCLVALTERHHKLSQIMLKIQIVLGSLQNRLSPKVQQTALDVEVANQATEEFARVTAHFLDNFGGKPVANAGIKALYKVKFTNHFPRLEKVIVEHATGKIEPFAEHPGSGANQALWPGEFKAAMHPGRTGFYETKRLLNNGNALIVDFNGAVARSIKFHTARLAASVLVSARGDIKKALNGAHAELGETLDALHGQFRSKAGPAGVATHRVNLANEQIERRKRDLDQTFQNASRAIGTCHVDAAGPLATDIESKLTAAYSRAHKLAGSGARVAMANELITALDRDNVVGGTLAAFDRRISEKLDDVLSGLSGELSFMANSIVADYNGSMSDRVQTTQSTGHAGLDRIRNQMIAYGYDDLRVVTSDGVPGSSVDDEIHVVKSEMIENGEVDMDLEGADANWSGVMAESV